MQESKRTLIALSVLAVFVSTVAGIGYRFGYDRAELKYTKLDLERTENLKTAAEAEARYVKSLLMRIQEADEKMDSYRANVARLSERVRIAEAKRRKQRPESPEGEQLGKCESLLREGVELAEESGQIFPRAMMYN